MSESSEVLEKAKEIIADQHDYLRGIFAQSYSYAIVLALDKRITMPDKASDSDYLPSEKHKEDTCVIIHQNQKMEVLYTKRQKKDLKLHVGDTVKCVQTKTGIGIKIFYCAGPGLERPH